MVHKAAMTSVAQPTPLSPQAMASAGVPLKEALWFFRIPSGRPRVEALSTPTGKRILDQIRAHFGSAASTETVPATA